MPKRLRPIAHEDRLSVIDHLDELRSRLIVCASVLVVVFGVCFWQNAHLLNALNAPLHHLSKTARNHISGITGVRSASAASFSTPSVTCSCSPAPRPWRPATGR